MDWWWYVLIAVVILAAVALLLRGRNRGVPGSGPADPTRANRETLERERLGEMNADDPGDLDQSDLRNRKIQERDQPPPPPAG